MWFSTIIILLDHRSFTSFTMIESVEFAFYVMVVNEFSVCRMWFLALLTRYNIVRWPITALFGVIEIFSLKFILMHLLSGRCSNLKVRYILDFMH
jgi:hypothetical protein